MELKIYNPQDNGFLKKIDWNFDELKAEITASSQEYETSVYTDDTIFPVLFRRSSPYRPCRNAPVPVS